MYIYIYIYIYISERTILLQGASLLLPAKFPATSASDAEKVVIITIKLIMTVSNIISTH